MRGILRSAQDDNSNTNHIIAKHLKNILLISASLVLLLSAGGFILAATSNMLLDLDVTGGVGAQIKWATPELRYGPPETNDDADFFLTVSDTSTHAIVYAQTVTATTYIDGTYTSSTIFFPPVAAGTYDVGIKTNQHLTRKLRNVALIDGVNTLNFTQPDNSAPKGSQVLLAGDINMAGTSTATYGDDKVNGLDLSVMLNDFNSIDPTAHAYRSNLTRDTKVNALDLTIILKNFNQVGDN